MPDYVLRVLGPPSVEKKDGGTVEGLSNLLLLLVAYLALHPRPQPRDQVARLFWPHRHSLRQLLSRARTRLPGLMEATSDLVGIRHAGLDTDLRALEEAIGEGSLEQAVALWKGEFLEGVARPGSWELEDWMERERARIHRLLETALAHAIQERLARSRPLDAAELLAGLQAFPASDNWPSVVPPR